MATHVATNLPDVDLAPGMHVIVTLSDAAGSITKLNVYGTNPVTGARAELELLPPILVYPVGT